MLSPRSHNHKGEAVAQDYQQWGKLNSRTKSTWFIPGLSSSAPERCRDLLTSFLVASENRYITIGLARKARPVSSMSPGFVGVARALPVWPWIGRPCFNTFDVPAQSYSAALRCLLGCRTYLPVQTQGEHTPSKSQFSIRSTCLRAHATVPYPSRQHSWRRDLSAISVFQGIDHPRIE